MASDRIVITLKNRWWLTPYLCLLVFAHRILRVPISDEHVERVIDRGIKVVRR